MFSTQKSFLPIFAAIFCYFYALTSNAVGFYTYFIWMYIFVRKAVIVMRTSPARRRGFTLVELIVVLTILAVLAALLVPALTGYIDKANEAKVLAEARTVLTASQATVSEAYAKGQLVSSDSATTYDKPNENAAHYLAKQVWELSEFDPNNKKITWRFTVAAPGSPTLTPGVIDTFEYCNGAYRIAYHAIGTDEYPTGWNSAEKATELPALRLDDGGKPFLESSDYDPGHYHPAA